jgi:hypothetical protein
MPKAQGEPQTFVEMVRLLLEDRFPWLGKGEEEVSGADTVQDLSDLHEELVHRCSSVQPSS